MDENVSQDAQTLSEVLARDERDGYRGQFRVVEAGRLQCLTCRHVVAASDVDLERLHRLEGASDPDDMLAVVGLACPNCGTQGTVVLNYGPESTPEEAEVLLAFNK